MALLGLRGPLRFPVAGGSLLPARGFVVARAAPMDRRPTKKGGPYTCPEVAQNGQYGVMDVHDGGARVSVRLQGMRGNLEVPGMRLEIVV